MGEQEWGLVEEGGGKKGECCMGARRCWWRENEGVWKLEGTGGRMGRGDTHKVRRGVWEKAVVTRCGG